MNSLRPLAASPSLRPVMTELQQEIDRSQERLDEFRATPPPDLEQAVFDASLKEHQCVTYAGLGAVAVAFGLAIPVLTLPGIVVGSAVIAVNLYRWRKAVRRTRELEAAARGGPAYQKSLDNLQSRLDQARQALARGGNAQQVLDLAQSPSSDLAETPDSLRLNGVVLKKRPPGTNSPLGES